MRDAAAAGYKVNLVFVGVDDAALSISRVADRARAGGHDVPPDAIVRRFHGALAKLGTAVETADRAVIFDNSGKHRRIILVHELGGSSFIAESVPEWTRKALRETQWRRQVEP